jgi:hypothetical protein
VHDVAVVDDVNTLGQRQRCRKILLDQHDGLAGGGKVGQVLTRSWTMTGARPSNGSSSRMTLGSRTNARAIASICCSPPESSLPRLARRCFSRGNIA